MLDLPPHRLITSSSANNSDLPGNHRQEEFLPITLFPGGEELLLPNIGQNPDAPAHQQLQVVFDFYRDLAEQVEAGVSRSYVLPDALHDSLHTAKVLEVQHDRLLRGMGLVQGYDSQVVTERPHQLWAEYLHFIDLAYKFFY